MYVSVSMIYECTIMRLWVWDVYMHLTENMAEVGLYVCVYKCKYERLSVNIHV